MASETRNIGVLYLDSREKGSLLAPHTRTALDTLAAEAGVAIENARLYRETLDKARLEHELKIAAEIQKALLPEGNHDGAFFRASGSSVQARSIGGDFFDLIDMPDGGFGFLVGDVAGKGPAAALLTAKILGIFSAFASVGDDPAQTVDHINKVLTRRQIDARYATLLYGQLQPNGKLMFCNGGQNPPLVFGVGGLRRIEAGGMPVGLFEAAPYANDSVDLQPGDTMILYSDGVTEAHNVAGDEFGEDRMVQVLKTYHKEPATVVLEKLIDAVKVFATGAEQYDDVTALVVQYTGPR
jgi:sigma-B regulation protein RsbU (phosphoserine phosphatase)